MVQTRRQWQNWRDNNFEDTQSQRSNSFDDHAFEQDNEDEPCEECADEMPRSPYGGPCHRKRDPDDSPYGVQVQSYRRRNPKKY